MLAGPVVLAQVVESRGGWSGVGSVFGTIAAAADRARRAVAWRLQQKPRG